MRGMRSTLRARACLVAACLVKVARADEPAPITPPAGPAPVPDPSPVVLGGNARDGTARPVNWKRARFSTADYAITLVGGAATLVSAIVQPLPNHVGGGVLFDDRVRSALRPADIETRYAFRDASDVALSLNVVWPFFVDALATTWWYRGSRDTAQEMALLGLETFAVIGTLQGVTNVLVSRERPYGGNCDSPELPGNAIDCTSSSHYRSFFSGHAAFSFTGAALVCLNHLENELLGGPWDIVSCATAYAVAGTTSTFRVVGDVHYSTDILTGALVGTAVGYGVPLLHRRVPEAATLRTNGATLKLVPSGLGLGLLGSF